MAIDFPNSPTVSQSFTAGGSTWIWDGIAWTLQRITTGAQGPQGEVGPQGPQGPTGPQGTSINVKASVATIALLPSSGNSANDARIVDADGDLYIWGGSSWTSAGQIVGPQGPQGIQGIQGIQGLTGATGASGGITLAVTNSGSGSYTINGSANPTLSFIRGHRYVINVSAVGHPFWIQTVSGAYSAGNVYTTGITLSSGTRDNGTIIFEVPFNAPQLYYACEYHSSMAGSITVSNLGPQGIQGPKGDTGEQGIQGIQGLTGNTGAQGGQGIQGIQGLTGAASTVPGPTGPAGTISVASTTTLTAGSAASVTNSGTSTAAVLSFGIPQGPQGIQGLTGAPGETFPPQTGNTGKFLSTDGSSPVWATVTTTPAAGSITNAMLANSSISINSSPVALGANINLATTAYSNGTNTANSNKIFYNSSGVQPTGTAAGDLYIFF